jgi:hypothetical protein
MAGYVFFRPVKGSKVHLDSTDRLDEVDIPVSGVVFRF